MRTVIEDISERAGEPAGRVDASAASAALSALTPGDLADLLGAFNEASQRLQTSHEALRSEVARLKGQLASANEQLERSRRLAALGEMAAGIAHEIRNPLGSIRLYARMLEQDLADRPSEREVASKVARAVRGLDAVVGDVLAFSREMKPRVEALGVSDLLDRACEEALAGVGRGDGLAGVRVVRLDRQREGGEIRADEMLLHRALVNVIRNAAEAIEERTVGAGGAMGREVAERERTIVLETRSVRRGGRWRSIVVRDSGGGLSDEAMRRMFNPFFTTRAAGTGLGLAIVHRIVDAHGGRIWVSNAGAERLGRGAGGEEIEVGAGARIEVALPEFALEERGEAFEQETGSAGEPVATVMEDR
ncbi:MAG: hypothetical protein KF768_12110 [Phycisphaeraceae bacterium]|nr:hypothetical protein [Phycisphaeraceae bacterium]